MLKPDQTSVVSVAGQVLDVADVVPDPFGGHLGDHELSWPISREMAVIRFLPHGSQYSRTKPAR